MIESGRVYSSEEAQKEVDLATGESFKELVKMNEYHKGFRDAIKLICEIFVRER